VSAVRRGDHDEVELCSPLPDLVGRAEHDDIRMFPKRLGPAFVVAGDDDREPKAGRRGDERGVKNGACEAVTEEGDVRRRRHASLSRTTVPVEGNAEK
jgi:hypothetical protein